MSKHAVGEVQVLDKPVMLEIPTWRAMQYDAELVVDGLTWRRAKDGFGDFGDREDWVLDIPALSAHVGLVPRRKWDGKHDTREEAMRARVKETLRRAPSEITAVERDLADLMETQRLLAEAVSHE